MGLPGSVWGLNRPGIKKEFAYYHHTHFKRVSRVHKASMHVFFAYFEVKYRPKNEHNYVPSLGIHSEINSGQNETTYARMFN